VENYRGISLLGDTGIDVRITLKRMFLKHDAKMQSVIKWLKINSGFCNDHDIFLGHKTAATDCNHRILTEDSV
jgi:hypothetical protein